MFGCMYSSLIPVKFKVSVLSSTYWVVESDSNYPLLGCMNVAPVASRLYVVIDTSVVKL